MANNRNFWLAIMGAIVALYLAALVLAAQGALSHFVVRLAVIFIAAHLLEIPIAFRQLRGRNAAPARVILATLLFGAAWWVPARRGVFAVA